MSREYKSTTTICDASELQQMQWCCIELLLARLIDSNISIVLGYMEIEGLGW